MDDDTTFTETLAAALARHIDGFEQLLTAERLSGGASQETYRLDVVVDGAPTRFALRRAAGGTTAGVAEGRPGLAVEARLMQAAREAGVPEPVVHAVLEPGDGLGDGFVMEWLAGETLGARIVRSPVLAEVRPRLAYECGQILATIHGIDPVATGLAPHLTTVSTEQFVREIWQGYQDLASPQPMIDYTARWLLDHLPPEVGPRLVHNDFRNGNLLVNSDGVAAVLDWEVCHLGDPGRDLGWICTNSWRFGRRDKPVGGFGSYEDLFAGYASVSGHEVDPDHVRWWEVFGSFWWAVGCLRMAEHWRSGPDPTVERPAIGRRSSECQVDCVNLLIPGPVELVAAEPAEHASTSVDLPSTTELLASVADFLRTEPDLGSGGAASGRTRFLARVAANSLDIATRELTLGPTHRAAEHTRLRALLGASADGDPLGLRQQLAERLRDGSMPLDSPGLAEHLRTTVVNQTGIDQPTYSGYLAALDQAL